MTLEDIPIFTYGLDPDIVAAADKVYAERLQKVIYEAQDVYEAARGKPIDSRPASTPAKIPVADRSSFQLLDDFLTDALSNPPGNSNIMQRCGVYRSSRSFSGKVAHLITRIKASQSRSDVLDRILRPHGFDGTQFKDDFVLQDLRDDVRLFIAEGFLFLRFELSVLTQKGWRLLYSCPKLSDGKIGEHTADPAKRHVTKVYFRHEAGSHQKKKLPEVAYKGIRIFRFFEDDMYHHSQIQTDQRFFEPWEEVREEI